MNRMSPLVARRPQPTRAVARAVAMPIAQPDEQGSDLRFFVMAWLGGLVFFATYLA